MDVEDLRDYCLTKRGATESLPFGPDTLVFKVGGKIFLLVGLDEGASFNVKCDPEQAIELREKFEDVRPGYHMNKTHWNTVYMKGRLSDAQLKEFIDQSYELVFKSLAKKIKESLT